MLGFIHTAQAHVARFEELTRSLAPGLTQVHEVHEELLVEVRAAGAVTHAVESSLAEVIAGLRARGARVVVVTCSTLGAAAELSGGSDRLVLRIDRPMIEHAVASGRRILLAAALPSALRAAESLVQQIADELERKVVVSPVWCNDAWTHFEQGDASAYASSIAASITGHAHADDLVLLTQASMEPALALLERLGIRALSSPRLGIERALDLYARALAPA